MHDDGIQITGSQCVDVSGDVGPGGTSIGRTENNFPRESITYEEYGILIQGKHILIGDLGGDSWCW